jgi:hypothetical protein
VVFLVPGHCICGLEGKQTATQPRAREYAPKSTTTPTVCLKLPPPPQQNRTLGSETHQ